MNGEQENLTCSIVGVLSWLVLVLRYIGIACDYLIFLIIC